VWNCAGDVGWKREKDRFVYFALSTIITVSYHVRTVSLRQRVARPTLQQVSAVIRALSHDPCEARRQTDRRQTSSCVPCRLHCCRRSGACSWNSSCKTNDLFADSSDIVSVLRNKTWPLVRTAICRQGEALATLPSTHVYTVFQKKVCPRCFCHTFCTI